MKIENKFRADVTVVALLSASQVRFTKIRDNWMPLRAQTGSTWRVVGSECEHEVGKMRFACVPRVDTNQQAMYDGFRPLLVHTPLLRTLYSQFILACNRRRRFFFPFPRTAVFLPISPYLRLVYSISLLVKRIKSRDNG